MLKPITIELPQNTVLTVKTQTRTGDVFLTITVKGNVVFVEHEPLGDCALFKASGSVMMHADKDHFEL